MRVRRIAVIAVAQAPPQTSQQLVILLSRDAVLVQLGGGSPPYKQMGCGCSHLEGDCQSLETGGKAALLSSKDRLILPILVWWDAESRELDGGLGVPGKCSFSSHPGFISKPQTTALADGVTFCGACVGANSVFPNAGRPVLCCSACRLDA